MPTEPYYEIEIRKSPLIEKDLNYIIPIEMEGDGPDYWTKDDFALFTNQKDDCLGAVALLRDVRQGGKYLKSRGGNRIVGYVCMRFAEEFQKTKRKLIVIERLAVDKQFRRKGIGTALLSWVISLLTANRSLIIIPVNIDNTDGQIFLTNCSYGSKKKSGRDFNSYCFCSKGFVKKYFDNGDTAVIYRYLHSPFLQLSSQVNTADVSDKDFPDI